MPHALLKILKIFATSGLCAYILKNTRWGKGIDQSGLFGFVGTEEGPCEERTDCGFKGIREASFIL